MKLLEAEKFEGTTVKFKLSAYFLNFLKELLNKDYLFSETKNKVRQSKNELEIKDIYYSICWLSIQFRTLGNKFQSRDDQNGSLYFSFRQSLRLLRDEIYHLATIDSINLKSEVSVKDYNLSGKYIELYERKNRSRETTGNPTMRAVALYHHYSNQQLNPSNADEFAKGYGWIKKYSGKKLYDTYNKYYKRPDRVGDEGSPRGNKAKLNDLGCAIEMLEDNGFSSNKAKDEYKTLAAKVEEYSKTK